MILRILSFVFILITFKISHANMGLDDFSEVGAASAGVCHKLGIPQTGGDFGARVSRAAVHGAVGTAVEATLSRKNVGDALKDNVASGVVDVASGLASNKLGDLYKNTDDLNYITHKVLHGVVGGVMGGALGTLKGEDLTKSLATGAIGSVIGEMIAEEYRDQVLSGHGIALADVDKHKEWASALAQTAAVLAATLADVDPTIAQQTAKMPDQTPRPPHRNRKSE